MYGAGDVRVETVPDARVIEPTDALVAATRACICGSDLWPYKTMEHTAMNERESIKTCSLPTNEDDSDLAVAHTSAGAEELARKAPGAAVVSALGSVPSEVLFGVFDARDRSPRPGMVYCGDDAEAKEVAAQLIRDVGFDPVDAGSLRVARYIEPFTLLVGQPAYEGEGGPEQAGAASGAGTAQAASAQDSQTVKITRSGSQPPRQGPAENFTGSVRVDTQFQANALARASGARVTFEPGARTAWHSHPLGQTLSVTAGVGRVQRWGDPVDEIRQGDVVWIPPGQKHWHGASPNAAMSHIAIVEQLDGKSTDWMEKVSDAQYAAPFRAQGSATPARPATGAQPTPAQRLIGDFSPKLVELTDDVLFGDIWERPELSKRDRSPVTVAALIALNRPDQLRSHLARARERTA